MSEVALSSGPRASSALMRRAGMRAVQKTMNPMPLLLAAPLVLFMLAFYAVPVVSMLMRSVSDPSWTVANYAALPDDPVFLKVFWNTLVTSVRAGRSIAKAPMSLLVVPVMARSARIRPKVGANLKP